MVHTFRILLKQIELTMQATRPPSSFHDPSHHGEVDGLILDFAFLTNLLQEQAYLAQGLEVCLMVDKLEQRVDPDSLDVPRLIGFPLVRPFVKVLEVRCL